MTLTIKVLLKLDPEYSKPVLMTVTPSYALEQTMLAVDKKFGKAWDTTAVPTDTIETVMYRAGAKSYRDQVLKELHVTSKGSIHAGH